MSKVASYKKREKAEIIAFSPIFKQRIRDIRSKLGIPENGFPKDVRTVEGPITMGFPKDAEFSPDAGKKWYVEHVQQATGKIPESFHRNLPTSLLVLSQGNC